jgi:hypothetical protein
LLEPEDNNHSQRQFGLPPIRPQGRRRQFRLFPILTLLVVVAAIAGFVAFLIALTALEKLILG